MYYQKISSDKARKLSENNIKVYKLTWDDEIIEVNPKNFYLKFLNKTFYMEISSERFDSTVRTTKAIIYSLFPKNISIGFVDVIIDSIVINKVIQMQAGFEDRSYLNSHNNEFENDVVKEVTNYLCSSEFKTLVVCSSN